MKKFFKILGYFFATIIGLLLITYIYFTIKWNRQSSANMELAGPEAPVLNIDGYEFRDLNKNGKLDVYEDSRANIEDRIEDLISQMNIGGKGWNDVRTFSGDE